MKFTFYIAVILLTASGLQAQDRPTYRTSYLRLGVNSVGNELDEFRSPRENVLDGRYGTIAGVALDAGKIFYFGGLHSENFLNLGLDWTVLSLAYNQFNRWDDYGRKTGATGVIVDGTRVMASAATKIGPVLSINLIEKVVIDTRFQFAPTFRYIDLNYYENASQPDERFLSFIKNGRSYLRDSFDFDGIDDRTTFSIAKSIGVTVRRNALGLSADYIWGDIKRHVESTDGNIMQRGNVNIPVTMLQLKLNISF